MRIECGRTCPHVSSVQKWSLSPASRPRYERTDREPSASRSAVGAITSPADRRAAELVTKGVVKSPREVELESQLTSEQKARRDAEFKASEFERENQRLHETIRAPKPPTPSRKKFSENFL